MKPTHYSKPMTCPILQMQSWLLNAKGKMWAFPIYCCIPNHPYQITQSLRSSPGPPWGCSLAGRCLHWGKCLRVRQAAGSRCWGPGSPAWRCEGHPQSERHRGRDACGRASLRSRDQLGPVLQRCRVGTCDQPVNRSVQIKQQGCETTRQGLWVRIFPLVYQLFFQLCLLHDFQQILPREHRGCSQSGGCSQQACWWFPLRALIKIWFRQSLKQILIVLKWLFSPCMKTKKCRACWPLSNRWSEQSPVPLLWCSELQPHSGSAPWWASPPQWRWPSALSHTAPTPA